MVNNIVALLSNLGGVYPIFSPLLGITGAFITGSTTISNVVFGPSQLEIARLLALDINVLLALQLNGAGIGNAICFLKFSVNGANMRLLQFIAYKLKTGAS